ncbi:MAG TPA: DUF983 domain-containing protein, partial [Methylomirabilota bacterium]|nr:DUF983 domain-containing protein [Methylomirabilota bacterium]
MTAETWTNTPAPADTPPRRALWPSIRRGLLGRCPHCGEGRLFGQFLKTVDRCDACGEDMHHHRADDLPPYITIVIVGHIVVPLVLFVEKTFHPDVWIQMTAWLPVTLALTLVLLQPIKGGVVGLQWANRMHGFGGADD